MTNFMEPTSQRDIKANREMAEYISVYGDPKYARKAFSLATLQRFARPALKPKIIIDVKSGEPLPQSQLEVQIYDQLIEELKDKGITREPTEGEMMIACQAYYARHNSASFVTFRDTAGAKPVDETKLAGQEEDPYESMTDDELEALASFRLAREAKMQISKTKPIQEVNADE